MKPPPGPASTNPPARDLPRSHLFWPAVLAGWAVMIWALLGLLHQRRDTNPAALGRLFLGLDLLHDLLLAPIVVGVGLIMRRLVPRRARAAVQAALLCSGVLVLVSAPSVRGYGRRRANPSILPNNYGHGLLVVLAGVWAVAALTVLGAAIIRHFRHGRLAPTPAPTAPPSRI